MESSDNMRLKESTGQLIQILNNNDHMMSLIENTSQLSLGKLNAFVMNLLPTIPTSPEIADCHNTIDTKQ